MSSAFEEKVWKETESHRIFSPSNKTFYYNNLKKERKKIMAKIPVSMTIDGYKEREVLMVTYEFSQALEVIKREVFL